MKILIKRTRSKLDPYSKTLLTMEREGKTCQEMRTWLKSKGVVVALGTLSHHLRKLRLREREEKLFSKIFDVSKLGRGAGMALRKHPAPKLDVVIGLLQGFIVELMTEGTADKDLLRLAGQLTRAVAAYEKMQGQNELARERLELQKRWVAVAEKREGMGSEAPQAEPMLSPEERERLLDEIYGRVRTPEPASESPVPHDGMGRDETKMEPVAEDLEVGEPAPSAEIASSRPSVSPSPIGWERAGVREPIKVNAGELEIMGRENVPQPNAEFGTRNAELMSGARRTAKGAKSNV